VIKAEQGLIRPQAGGLQVIRTGPGLNHDLDIIQPLPELAGQLVEGPHDQFFKIAPFHEHLNSLLVRHPLPDAGERDSTPPARKG